MGEIDDLDYLEGTAEFVEPDGIVITGPIDVDGVLGGCDFIKHCLTTQEPLTILQRTAFISVMRRLSKGREMFLSAMKIKPDYNGPVLESIFSACGENVWYSRDIAKVYPHCDHCNSNPSSSPIYIRTDNFLATQETGFWITKTTTDGSSKKTMPAYRDLVRYFIKNQPYISGSEGLTYIFNGTHWESITRPEIEAFADTHFDPKPTRNQALEFFSIFKRTNLVKKGWFLESTKGFINLKNGVFDIKANKLLPHEPRYGFRSCLPYDYKEDATCPAFMQFLDDVTCGRDDLQQILLEFFAAVVADVPPHKLEKCLVLTGVGSNGKSTFIKLIKALVGSENTSEVGMSNLSDPNERALMEGKLVNLSEETDVMAFDKSADFKSMVTGGNISVKHLYVNKYSIENTTKIIMACNDLPKSTDRSHGFFRRLLIIPFDMKITEVTRNINIHRDLKNDLSGIFNLLLSVYRQFEGRDFVFSDSVTMTKILNTYKKDNDPVLQWFEEYVNYDAKSDVYWVTSSAYRHFRNFCEDSGIRPLALVTFSKRLRAALDYDIIRPSVDGKRPLAILGLSLK